MKRTVIAIAIVFLAGCATNPPVAPTSTEWHSRVGPFPSNYKEMTTAYFDLILKDPESARYRFGAAPIPCYMRAAPVSGGDPISWGYCWQVHVNAKNSYGGYTGGKIHDMFAAHQGYKAGQVGEYRRNMWFSEPWLRETP